MDQTTVLFSTPSVLEGISRLIDFGSTLNVYNSSKTAEDADCKAIKSDWEAVGKDIKKAMDSIDR